MNKDACCDTKEYNIALDLWGRGIKLVESLDDKTIEILNCDGHDLKIVQEILDENYDIWTENREWYFSEGYNFMID